MRHVHLEASEDKLMLFPNEIPVFTLDVASLDWDLGCSGCCGSAEVSSSSSGRSEVFGAFQPH